MAERLDDGQIGVGQVYVLADDAHPDRAHRSGDLVNEVFPAREVDRVISHVDLQDLHDVAVEALFMEHQGDLVDVVGVHAGHDGLHGDVAQQRDLPLQVLGDHPVGTTHDHVGLDALAA